MEPAMNRRVAHRKGMFAMYSQRPSIVKARALLAMPGLTSQEIAAATRQFAESVSNPKVKALLLEAAQYQERTTMEGEPQERTVGIISRKTVE
jgi:hypothetical protein